MDSTAEDYGESILEVAARIASIENREIGAVLNDLLMPNADVLRFRLATVATEAGTLPFQEGINLLEGAKKALLAAACSVLSPRTHHPRMSRTEAEQLLTACRLGQTETGSYVVKSTCPLDAVDYETPAVGETVPFVRRATQFLLRSSKRLVDAIEKDEVEKLYEETPRLPVISSNLCEALLKMQAVKDNAVLSISAKWATTLPPSGGESTPERVVFNPDYFKVISKILDNLRPSAQQTESVYVGTVETLNGDFDEFGKRSGEVTLEVLQEGENLPVRINLDANQYVMADKAHMSRNPVMVKGVLRRGRRLHRITEVQEFRLLT
jgi:hypothetical protein